MTDEQIREIFLANGFTVKEGQTDLKPYVYAAARELINATLEEAALKQYPLPDDLYDSKDWKAGGYAQRAEWLHVMYESKKQEVEAALKPCGEFVARVDDLERGGRVRALLMGLALDAPLYTAAPTAQPDVKPWEPAPVCSACGGTGVDGDIGNDGRPIDVVCPDCAGTGKSRFRGKCKDGHRCLNGCFSTEPCRYAATPPAQTPVPPRLTDMDITAIYTGNDYGPDYEFARAIENAVRKQFLGDRDE